jgi:hypothetical protein
MVETLPRAHFGGTERVASLLTEKLVRRGHEVTIFASGDSTARARLIPTASPPWVQCLCLPGVNYGLRSVQPASATLQLGSKRLLVPGGLAARGWTDPVEAARDLADWPEVTQA